MAKYISAWEIHTGSLRNILAKAVSDGEIATDDIVWNGPAGDSVVAATAFEIEEEYAEYLDGGTVEEYLDD